MFWLFVDWINTPTRKCFAMNSLYVLQLRISALSETSSLMYLGDLHLCISIRKISMQNFLIRVTRRELERHHIERMLKNKAGNTWREMESCILSLHFCCGFHQIAKCYRYDSGG